MTQTRTASITEIIKHTGVDMEAAVYLRAHVHQAWKRRCRVMS